MARKSWFLCPDLTFLPNGQIALGRIIPNPRHPTITLASLADYPTIVLPEITSIVEKNRSFSNDKDRSFGTKLFAKFLEIANGEIDMSRDKSKTRSFGAVDHEVRAFSGAFTTDALKAIVALDNVKKHIDSGRFGKRYVYIISGLRVAQQSFTVTDEKGSKTAASAGASVPIPTGAVPAAVGASITNDSKHETKKNYETAPGIVFAYRLHVIRSKNTGEEGELFSSRSAFFSGEAEDEDEEFELVEVNRAMLQDDLDEMPDGYSENWFEEEEDDESYIVSEY
ncbi:hypothetical protein HDV63DRAFT_381101 [Trichoderma sp. SZMC 28014]